MNYDEDAVRPVAEHVAVTATLLALVRTHPDKRALEASLKTSLQSAIDLVLHATGMSMELQETVLAVLDQEMEPVYRALHEQ